LVDTGASYRVPSIFRPPPSDPSAPYEPYVSTISAEAIEKYTVPNIRAIMQELVMLGALDP